MSGARKEALTEFVATLQRLRMRAGGPSLENLVTLTADLPHPLARSTISDKLMTKTVPNWEFVVSFVTACRAYAERKGQPLPQQFGDLALWGKAHEKMLRTIEAAADEARLVAAARTDIIARMDVAAGEPARPQRMPRLVPAPTLHFVGRDTELAKLTGLVPQAATSLGGAIAVVCGMAGVGKTTLALHWAHQMTGQFPDGQLYVNLRGFGPTDSITTAEEALQGFLETLGVPAQQIPIGREAQIDRYRSLLAGRRILVVLDNARDSAQVRPLLPATPGCVAVVTSRDRLTKLIVSEGAEVVTVDPLSMLEAQELLARRIGGPRVGAEPQAVHDIILACGRLPLTLAIVAGRATIHRGFTLSALAAELVGANGLDAFANNDAECDARAVISWSYDRLSTAAARLLRLIGLHPGPDLTASAAASLAGLAVKPTRRLLAELADMHLVIEHAPGRYSLHDLLRVYADEQAHGHDSAAEHNAATQRMLDHYLHSAFAAATRLDPHLYTAGIQLPAPATATHPDDPSDAGQAKAWFTAEYPALSVAIRWAVTAEFDRHAWQLAWTLGTFLNRQGRWQDWSEAMRAALEPATRLGDPIGLATVHRGLGSSLARLGHYERAQGHLQQSLTLYETAGNDTGRAYAHLSLAWTYQQLEQPKLALDHNRRAHRLFRATANLPGQADTLNAIGWQYALQGHLPQALKHCQQAQAICHRIGDADGEAAAWDSLGYIHHQLAEYPQAITCYLRALDIHQDRGDRYYTADTLVHLADSHHNNGDQHAARAALQRALTILDDLRHKDADLIRARLKSA